MAYQCTKCDAEFSTREALRVHQFNHLHPDGADNTSDGVEQNNNNIGASNKNEGENNNEQ